MTLKFPHTMTSIEGLKVNVDNNVYVFPLSVVKECTKMNSVEVEMSNGRKKIKINGETVPYLRLREMFNVEGNLSSR